MLCYVTYVRMYVRMYVKLPMVYMGVSEKVSTTQLAISRERMMIHQWIIYGGIQNKSGKPKYPTHWSPKCPSFPNLVPIFSPSLRDQSPILEFHILLLRSIVATQPGWEQHHGQVDAVETEEAQRLRQALGMPKGMLTRMIQRNSGGFWYGIIVKCLWNACQTCQASGRSWWSWCRQTDKHW